MQKPKVFQHKLNNGLIILVVEKHNIPKVSIKLWYNVGSKDEKSGEKGIAHFIEHMIFKGTNTLLSESDIKHETFPTKHDAEMERLRREARED